MIKYAFIYGLISEDEYSSTGVVGIDVFQKLAKIHPSGVVGKNKDCFECKLPLADPRIKKIVALLDSIGFSPLTENNLDDPRRYSYKVFTQYELSDFESAEYLSFTSKETAQGTGGPGGPLFVFDEELPLTHDLVSMEQQRLVSSSFRRRLESSGLKHVSFKPVGVKEKESRNVMPWPAGHEPYWELSSDLTLPRISPDCKLVDKDGNPVVDDFSNGCFLAGESETMEGEFKYRRSDLEKVGEFDLGKTYEKWSYYGIKGIVHLIASQRFYRFCVKENLAMNWVPVRLED